MSILPKKVKQLTNQNFTWVDINFCGKPQMEFLKKEFNFHPLDLKDCLPPLQRPKLLERPDYLFMILQFPVYNRQEQALRAAEIDFFIGKNFIVTVHNNDLTPVIELFNNCQKNTELKNNLLSTNPATLLYEILHNLIVYCYPILNHINLDLDEIEKNIFSGQQKTILNNIFNVRRNTINFRKTMQSHKTVIKKLIDRSTNIFIIDQKIDIYFKNLIEHTKEIWEYLENYKETIEALYSTNESMLSNRLNTIMKTLTIFSVIVFPLTLLAAIFGMNTLGGMPFVDSPFGFWAVVSIMILGTLIMFSVFKHKKWL
ncbi:MAG: magnesium transporter CorA family protein [Patescibacteria group bacterium]|jgi:magnesium transporter|nr:magnesium transporter CorA family protein [Patescibacteria group bacterium]